MLAVSKEMTTSPLVSTYWLSITSTPSGVASHPIVPPRAVNVPMPPRRSVNFGVAGGGCP
jgi:hypothetical protein